MVGGGVEGVSRWRRRAQQQDGLSPRIRCTTAFVCRSLAATKEAAAAMMSSSFLSRNATWQIFTNSERVMLST